MACFINFIGVSLAFVSFLKHAVVQGQNNVVVQGSDNAEQFSLLCRIYNVAKNPPINHVDLQDPHKIVNEIDALNASIGEDKRFNETEKMENSTDVQLKPITTREAAVAQAILRRIVQKAHTILGKITKINATTDIEEAKAQFTQVIFGEGKNESQFFDGVLNGIGGRTEACGNPGTGTKGSYAGKNLVVDFFCLCAMRTGEPAKEKEGVQDACKVKVGSKSEKHSWGSGAPSGSSSMWASIKKECGNLLHQHTRSTKEGNEVIEDFVTHLKSGGVYRWGSTVEDSGQKKGMLGTGVGKQDSTGGSGPVCDGSRGNTKGTPPAGICVYYGPENWEENIEWLKKLETALDLVDTLNDKTAAIQQSIEKLHMLLHRAEEIYENTKVITEIQHPVVPTNIQTAAKRLTAYDAAQRYHPCHFILTWVLLP
ncbi:Variant surface glycoprotein [Trypanosoma congolense IL3000]|uniref:Variant surface glycoprotein n=1 Tax=Trypanosoma congolense (strain IL3000) TaxID=1068625 RepID=F9WFJ7_TRYCI|nr:Variant surface glycoprotein [Trypanosoma congolense IL3000]